MKATLGLALLIGGLSLGSVHAETFSHPCEQVYYDLHTKKDDSKFDLNYLMECQTQFGETKTIKKAEAHKEAIENRLEKIEERTQQRVAIAKGERAGKLVRTFTDEDLKNFKGNVLRDSIAKSVTIVHPDDSRDEYDVKDDYVCKKFLGFEKATSSVVSEELFARDALNDDDQPKTLMEFRKRNFLGARDPKRYDFTKKRDFMFYTYYKSITCEREIQDGDTIDEFEIDIDQIRRQVESEIKHPTADESVLRILGMSRSAAEQVDDFETSYGNDTREEEWKAPEVEEDDFFMVIPK